MSEVRITINTDNAAFDGSDLEYELARILAHIQMCMTMGDINSVPEKIRDVNDNVVGTFGYFEG